MAAPCEATKIYTRKWRHALGDSCIDARHRENEVCKERTSMVRTARPDGNGTKTQTTTHLQQQFSRTATALAVTIVLA